MGIEKIAAIHGSPWKYDTYVPIFFAGNGVAARTISRPVGPQDIAATIAAYLEIKLPSGGGSSASGGAERLISLKALYVYAEKKLAIRKTIVYIYIYLLNHKQARDLQILLLCRLKTFINLSHYLNL